MRNITQRGIDLIKKYEGFVPHVYRCAGGYDTIGYGHLVRNRADFPRSITRIEAERLLVKDVAIAERAVLRFINVPLTDGQFDALVSFTFNLGAGALQRSTLRSKVNREQHDEVPAEFMRWVRAGGKVQRGLVRRRTEEARMYEGE
jgi:lysozyme